jgi:hypothetical protein
VYIAIIDRRGRKREKREIILAQCEYSSGSKKIIHIWMFIQNIGRDRKNFPRKAQHRFFIQISFCHSSELLGIDAAFVFRMLIAIVESL